MTSVGGDISYYLGPQAIPNETEVPGDDRYNGRLLVDTSVARFPSPKNAFDRGARRTDNNRFWTNVQLLNFTFGSSILNTGQVLSKSGILAATVCYIIAGSTIYLSEVLLVLAAEALSPRETAFAQHAAGFEGSTKDSGASIDELEYATVARRTLGWRGAKAVDIFITLQNFGSCLSYFILIGGLTTSVFSEWAETETSSAFARLWFSFYFVMPFMVLVFVLPPCLIRHFSNFRWLAVFSLCAISAVASLIIFGSPGYAHNERMASNPDPALSAPIRWWSWTGTLTKLGAVLLSANCTPAVFHSYSSMGNRTGSEWKRVVKLSMSMGILLYYGSGLTAYLSFRSATEADILDNFGGNLASCFKVLMVIHLVVYVPTEFVILRHSLFALANRDVMGASFCVVLVASLMIFVSLVGIVIGLMLGGVAEGDLFGYVVDLTGGISSSMSGLVLPGFIYLRATRGIINKSSVTWNRRGCYVLITVGVVAVLVVPTAVILSALGY